MALPSAYLTSSKNLAGILEAIQNAQAPTRFTQRYLESLGFASNSDRLVINVLKALGFLSDTGEPLERYHRFLDRTESKKVLAEGLRDAYEDLFQIRRDAHKMSSADVRNKMKTLSQGEYSDDVLSKMATTFKKLSDLADFEAASDTGREDDGDETTDDDVGDTDTDLSQRTRDRADDQRLLFDGFVYNINIHLPESRDPAVYDALFKSLKQHLR
jgi:hypothetical protein